MYNPPARLKKESSPTLFSLSLPFSASLIQCLQASALSSTYFKVLSAQGVSLTNQITAKSFISFCLSLTAGGLRWGGNQVWMEASMRMITSIKKL